MEIIELMEITEEEKELIMKRRMEELRKRDLDKLFSELRITLREIYENGGSVRLPWIGGKYVPGHHPYVKPNNIDCIY